MGTDLNFEVTFHSFLPMIVRFCTVQKLQLCTTKLQTKFCSLDFTTTDCSILQIVVLLSGNFQQFKVPTSSNCPKCSANPITVTPIGKWQFENKEHPIRGLYRTFFEKILFKFPFSHKRFQMGQKMYFYQLYKL